MAKRSTDAKQPVFTEEELQVPWGKKVIKRDKKTRRVLCLYQPLGDFLVLGVQGRGISKRIFVRCENTAQVNAVARSLLSAWHC